MQQIYFDAQQIYFEKSCISGMALGLDDLQIQSSSLFCRCDNEFPQTVAAGFLS